MLKAHRLLGVLSLVGLALFAAPKAQADFIAAADFSIASNPNGVWSYGYTTTLGGAFVLNTDSATNGPIISWSTNIGGSGNPVVALNNSGAPVQDGTINYLPNELVFHPGPGGELEVIRFTAPSAGSFLISADFQGRDINGASTDVHVLLNGVSLFDGFVSGFGSGSGPGVVTTQTLAAGDTVDFAVGFGPNGNYFYDSTGVNAQIGPAPTTPEPTSLALLGMGGLGALVVVRRRKR